MIVEDTDIVDVFVITPQRFGDHRGWFTESWNEKRMAEAGFDCRFVQDNQSFSKEPGTLRGLHYQSPPHAQAKLVRCLAGGLMDCVVDVRVGSPSYLKAVSVELTPENGKQLMIPAGCLHGFATLKPNTEICYKCTDFYAPDHVGSVLWSSFDLDWGVSTKPVLSDKDLRAPHFDEWNNPFIYQETP